MKLNRLEYALMNNLVRSAFQKHVETRNFLDLGGAVTGGRVLEIGCGRGVGAVIIRDVFGAAHVDAIDLDERMIIEAKMRNRDAKNIRFNLGDATAIAAPSDHYDAVFDFGTLHHVPNWPAVLREVYRVVKPGGRFFAQETMDWLITNPFSRQIMKHPQENRFNHASFDLALHQTGFREIRSRPFLFFFGWFVTRKPGESSW